jgi:iron complex outermembrane recepter protein
MVKFYAGLLVCLVSIVAMQPALPQSSTTTAEAPQSNAASNVTSLEEVVVTARKRAENQQDVPIAIQTFSGTQLLAQGVLVPTDLTQFVPGVQSQVAPGKTTSASFEVRGVVAVGFQVQSGSAVGVYMDGVNVPHPVGLNTAFFDISNVSVLKGPQGTLFGRNTTAGAVLVTSTDADFKGYHGYVQAEAGNYEDWRLGGAVNIPIIDDELAVRLAVDHWGRQGYGSDIVTGQHMGGDRDDTIVRASILFKPASNIESNTKLEYAQANRVMDSISALSLIRPGTYTVCNPALASRPACAGAILYPILNVNTHAPTTTTVSIPNPIAEAAAEGFTAPIYNYGNCVGGNLLNTCSTADPFDDVKTINFAETLTWDVTDHMSVKSVSGWHWFQDYSGFDETGTPGDNLVVGLPGHGPGVTYDLPTSLSGPDQKDSQYTQELDVTGDAGALKWLFGAFGSWDHGQNVEWSTPGTQLGPLQASGFPPGAMDTYAGMDYGNDTWALFSQEDYRFTDWFSLTGGLRYTEESVSQDPANFIYFPYTTPASSASPLAGQYLCLTGPKSGSIVPSPTPGCVVSPSETSDGESVTHAKNDGVSYLISANFQLNEDSLLYVSNAKGFRGALLQPFSYNTPPAKPEYVKDYEIGFKNDLFEHRLRANFAVYYLDYADKQETVVEPGPNGAPTSAVFNATSAKVKGFEGDLQAVVMTGLTVRSTLNYTDTRYGSYFPPGPGGTLVNATGTSFPEVSKWTYSLGARYELPVGPGRLGVQADWSWRSKLPETTAYLDPFVPPADNAFFTQAVGLLNGNLSYTFPQSSVVVSLFGTNLLDKRYATQEAGPELGGTVTADVQPPRMFGLRFRMGFGGE